MRIKRKGRDSLFIRRGRRIWFYDIVQAPKTSIMTTTLKRRMPSRGNTRQYWSNAADSSQDLSLQLANSMQPNNLIYNNLSYRRLTIRRSKAARARPRKTASAPVTRLPNDVLAAYKASCMRKTRRPSPLNVGELQVTSSHIHFTAHYLNSAPEDAYISLPLDGIVHIRRACYRRVLPHGVLIRCEGFPDYLMVLADREQQADVLQVLSNALRNTQDRKPSLPSTSDRLFEFDSASSVDRDCSLQNKTSVNRETCTELDEDLSATMAGEQNERSPATTCKEAPTSKGTNSSCSKPSAATPEPDSVRLESLKSVTDTAKTMSNKLLLSTAAERFKNIAANLLRKDGNVDEHLMEATILLVSAVLLLFVTLGVILAISSLRTRVIALTSLLIGTRT